MTFPDVACKSASQVENNPGFRFGAFSPRCFYSVDQKPIPLSLVYNTLGKNRDVGIQVCPN